MLMLEKDASSRAHVSHTLWLGFVVARTLTRLWWGTGIYTDTNTLLLWETLDFHNLQQHNFPFNSTAQALWPFRGRARAQYPAWQHIHQFSKHWLTERTKAFLIAEWMPSAKNTHTVCRYVFSSDQLVLVLTDLQTCMHTILNVRRPFLLMRGRWRLH